MTCKLWIFLIWLVGTGNVSSPVYVSGIILTNPLDGSLFASIVSCKRVFISHLHTQRPFHRSLQFSLLQFFSLDLLCEAQPIGVYLLSLSDYCPHRLISNILKTIVSYISSIEFLLFVLVWPLKLLEKWIIQQLNIALFILEDCIGDLKNEHSKFIRTQFLMSHYSFFLSRLRECQPQSCHMLID